MKISIALCSYNGAHYISDQLKSIKLQTRMPDELVVCDDGSNDETLAILYAFKEECSFEVNIYRNITRLGSVKNFEKAIGICVGDIIVLTDQDDVWVSEKLSIIEDVFEKHTDAGYVFSDAELINADGADLGHSLWNSLGFKKPLINRFKNGKQLSCLFRKPIVTGATMAIRASLKQYILPFPEKTFFVHDLWIALVASSINKCGLPLAEKLIQYRLHSDQQIGVKDSTINALYRDFVEYDKNNLIEHAVAYEFMVDHLRCLQKVYNLNVSESVFQIEKKYSHLNKRYAIHSAHPLARLRLLIQEILSGRYFVYSDSWKSIIRDLFSRKS